MNQFESDLLTALRDEAQEIAMTTDLNDGREVLDSRLDDVDRSRRRRQVTLGVVAAAAAAAAIAFVAVGRPTAAPQPADAGLETRYDGSAFDRPFRMDLPVWVTENLTEATDVSGDHVVFNLCPGDPDCIGLDFYAFTLLPKSAGPASYAGLLAAYEQESRDGAIKLYDKQVTEVSGREMTTFSVTTLRDRSDTLGCFADGSCEGFYIRNEDRYALIDAEGGPLLIGIRSFANNPFNDDRLPQLATALATLELLPSPPSTLPTEAQGVWESRLTSGSLKSTLSQANLGAQTSAVARELRIPSGGLDLRLYVDDRNMRLYTVASDGSEEMLDQHTCSRVSDRVVCIVDTDRGIETLVLRWAVSDVGLRITYLTGAGPTSLPGVPNEALERALYSTAVWVRSTT